MTEECGMAKHDWMQTFTGRRFFPTDPRVEDVCIEDIAHALSNTCRYGGHVPKFYSVAQHSVICSLIVEMYLSRDYEWGQTETITQAMNALMHDSAEAYVVDVPRPLKTHLSNYKEIENRVMAAIVEKFNLPSFHSAIKKADEICLATEARDLMGDPKGWRLAFPPSEMIIDPWTPQKSEETFLSRYNYLKSLLEI